MKMPNIEQLKKQYPIYTWASNSILRKKSDEVKNFNNELKDFAKILLALMHEYDWAWLAAPQIWKNIRMIAVCKYKIENDRYEMIDSFVMVNPIIIKHSSEQKIDIEWCLSFPGLEWEVLRYDKIEVQYQDINWNKKTLSVRWYNARIIQHEIDHLDWILLPDRLINWWLKIGFFPKN